MDDENSFPAMLDKDRITREKGGIDDGLDRI
jgi:hypothetical protein